MSTIQQEIEFLEKQIELFESEGDIGSAAAAQAELDDLLAEVYA